MEREVNGTEEENAGAVQKADAEQQVKVNWDAAQMKTAYANVCNVSSTREEVTLLFGTNQAWHAAQKELTVELSDRIVLNPYAAKRLSMVLSNVIQIYETRFGALPVEDGRKQAT